MSALLRALIDPPRARSGPQLPAELQVLYDGNLQFPERDSSDPYVIANFVTTLDGVVSYKIPGRAGGSPISGADEADHFIMGLLRASADAVLVGAGTVRDVNPESLWTPEQAYPPAAELYARYRRNSLQSTNAPVVIVSGSGRLELGRAVFRTSSVRTIVLTTSAGRARLLRAGVAALRSVEMHAINAPRGEIDSDAILGALRGLGVRIVLHEGGPKLFGRFLADRAVHELFLTLSPQIAGRADGGLRPGLVQGTQFLPEAAPWLELLSARQRGNHLYLRYRCTRASDADQPL